MREGDQNHRIDQAGTAEGRRDHQLEVAAGQVPECAAAVHAHQSEAHRGIEQQCGAQAEEAEGRHLRRAAERGLHPRAQQGDLPHLQQGRKVGRFSEELFFLKAIQFLA